MNSKQIRNTLDCMLRNVRINYFVLAADEFSNLNLALIINTTIIICNVDPSWLAGRHWICIYIDQKSKIYEFFDSYGQRVTSYGLFFTSLLKFRPVYNSMTIQSSFSNICGQYCLLFCYYKKLHYSMQSFIENVGFNVLKRKQNDRIAKKLFKLYVYEPCIKFQHNFKCRNQCSKSLHDNKKFIKQYLHILSTCTLTHLL